ncbi:hypothetical protein PTKIN_Ptkin09bG0153700 [Pterospermum kingtungense]
MFLTYASPVGNYFKVKIPITNLSFKQGCIKVVHASAGGAGGVKSISNYSPVMKALVRAKSQGFSDVLCLDSVNKKYLEEASASNIFTLKVTTFLLISNTLDSTMPLCSARSNRRSWSNELKKNDKLQGAKQEIGGDIFLFSLKLNQVEERAISVDELIDADEVFCTGTSVGSVTYRGRR